MRKIRIIQYFVVKLFFPAVKKDENGEIFKLFTQKKRIV